MADPRWTPAVEELVARAGLDVDSGLSWQSSRPDTQAMYRRRAAVILTALADAGALAPPAPPCTECGPGYRYGDEGCRHTPPDPAAQLARLVAAVKRVLGLAAHNNLIGAMEAIAGLREALPQDSPPC